MWNTRPFYQCIIVPLLHLALEWKRHFPEKERRQREILWDHPSASAQTPSGPPVLVHTIDTWAQIQCALSPVKSDFMEYSSDSSRTCSKKVTTKSADNQSVQKKVFSYILLSLSWRNQSSDFQKQWRLQPDFCHLSALRSSDNSVTEMTHWRTSQWADPTDLTQRVLTRTWPSLKTKSMNNLMVCVEDNWMYMLCRANATLRQRL